MKLKNYFFSEEKKNKSCDGCCDGAPPFHANLILPQTAVSPPPPIPPPQLIPQTTLTLSPFSPQIRRRKLRAPTSTLSTGDRLSRPAGTAANQRVPIPLLLFPFLLGLGRASRVLFKALHHRSFFRVFRRVARFLVRIRRTRIRARQEDTRRKL